MCQQQKCPHCSMNLEAQSTGGLKTSKFQRDTSASPRGLEVRAAACSRRPVSLEAAICRSGTKLRLRLHGKQRNTLHAELLARTAGIVGNELIGRIVLDLDDLEACRLDMRAVVVLLGAAADTRRPKG